MFTITLTIAIFLLLATLALQRWRRAHAWHGQNAALDAQLDSMLADFERFEKSMASESRRRRINRQLARASTPADSEPFNPNPKRKRGIPRSRRNSTAATAPATSAIPPAVTMIPSPRIQLSELRKIDFPAILPAVLNHAVTQTHRYIMFVARPLAAIPTLVVHLLRGFFKFGRGAPPSRSA